MGPPRLSTIPRMPQAGPAHPGPWLTAHCLQGRPELEYREQRLQELEGLIQGPLILAQRIQSCGSVTASTRSQGPCDSSPLLFKLLCDFRQFTSPL
jgi:hypothetical protein